MKGIIKSRVPLGPKIENVMGIRLLGGGLLISNSSDSGQPTQVPFMVACKEKTVVRMPTNKARHELSLGGDTV